ncbi:MAG: YtxH domain-containing protein [Ignavibacteriaceae bacterium]
MSHENNVGKGLLIGLLAGGAIGAAIALLYAPKSGRELRADIKSKADDYLDEAEKYMAEAKDHAKNVINEGKKKSEKLINDARVKSEELLKDAEKVFNDAKSKTSHAVNDGKHVIGNESERIKTALKAGVDAYKETKNS